MENKQNEIPVAFGEHLLKNTRLTLPAKPEDLSYFVEKKQVFIHSVTIDTNPTIGNLLHPPKGVIVTGAHAKTIDYCGDEPITKIIPLTPDDLADLICVFAKIAERAKESDRA